MRYLIISIILLFGCDLGLDSKIAKCHNYCLAIGWPDFEISRDSCFCKNAIEAKQIKKGSF